MKMATAASAKGAEPTSQQKAKILLVDDSPDSLLALEAVLEDLGQELVKAPSGVEALRYLLEDDFAAILLDVKMPGMDGFETAAMIRARKRSQHTPILFLTGLKNDDYFARGYDLGAVDFLTKPILPAVLKAKVSVFIELHRKAQLLERQAVVLRDAERKFRGVLEAAPDAMVVSDAYEHIRMVNTQTERLFGLNREELIAKPLSALLPHGKDATAARSDGKIFPVEVISSQLKAQDGPLTISVIRDVTERRNAEERDRRANAELEEKVIERTKELRRSNEELRQFAYVSSHDLKEPLRMVSNYTQLLERSCQGGLGNEAAQYIGYILQGVNRMHGLIEDLLSYSEIDSRNTFFKTVDSGAALREALANLQVPIVESGAEITKTEMPAVTGDHIQLVRVFQNLIGNSIKYRSKETPRIQISSERREDEWVFSVRDNGIGIEPRYKESIFKLFKRLHARSEYPGNGVGLASCRKIIERHGGKIWLELDSGSGATFRFTVPAAND